MKILDCSMNNVLASRLGKVALQAGDPLRADVGDSIDRGLILGNYPTTTSIARIL